MAAALHQLKAEFLRTLGHSARIQVLEMLSERELSMAQISSELDLEASTLSAQLAVLRRHGLVTTRRAGTTVYYSLTNHQIVDLLAMTRQILAGVLSDQVEVLSELRGKKSGEERNPRT
jgi:ArsR family transcriptional regulator